MKRFLCFAISILVAFLMFNKSANAIFSNVKDGELNSYELLCQYELQYDEKHYVSIYGQKDNKNNFAIVYQREGQELEWVKGTISSLNSNGSFSNAKSITDVRITGCPSAVFFDNSGAKKEICFSSYFGSVTTVTSVSSNCVLESNAGTNYGEDFVSSTLKINNTNVNPSSGLQGTASDEDFSGNEDCSGFLGDKATKGTPAYYLHVILITMRYLAIIMALVLSIVDFFKAIFSQDKDLLKKASLTAVKRLIFAVIVFFIPAVLEFILSLLGAYTVSCV